MSKEDDGSPLKYEHLPYDEERKICGICENFENCRVFFKLKENFEEVEVSQIFQSCIFMCHNCFLTERKKGYEPLLAGTGKDNLRASTVDTTQWYNQDGLLKLQLRGQEKVTSNPTSKE